jgi:hypothetical protein
MAYAFAKCFDVAFAGYFSNGGGHSKLCCIGDGLACIWRTAIAETNLWQPIIPAHPAPFRLIPQIKQLHFSNDATPHRRG